MLLVMMVIVYSRASSPYSGFAMHTYLSKVTRKQKKKSCFCGVFAPISRKLQQIQQEHMILFNSFLDIHVRYTFLYKNLKKLFKSTENRVNK